MRFFGLKSCDTCRKAQKVLNESGAAPIVIDVRADGVPPADLEAMLKAFGQKAINTRSTTWRSLSEEERSRPALELLAAHPTLLKRPVIEVDGTWYQGWSVAIQQSVLGND